MGLKMRHRKFSQTLKLSSSLIAAIASCNFAAAQDVADGELADLKGEIIVTATRQSQTLSKVPMSVTAYGQERLDTQGVRQIEDLSRLTPGVSFEKTSLKTNIAIRGISSGAGAATTGIYIDDTPIQVRSLGYSASNPYPVIFDLERVEILRGPQGTLFGAGSQGGTVRFLQTAPNMQRASVYGRAEVATTQNGDISYEGGIALGAPIIEDKLGFRASAYFRRDGGFIDRMIGKATVLSSNGSAGPKDSVLFVPTGVGKEDANSVESTSLRLALEFRPTETLKITPSVLYQKTYAADNNATFWTALSDMKKADFKTPMWVPTVDATHVAIPNAPLTEPMNERMFLPSLSVAWDAGPVEVISSTSYFDRNAHLIPNYTQLYQVTYVRRQVPMPGDFSISPQTNSQRNFTQELRFQSTNMESPFTWVVGGFYTRNKQRSIQDSQVNFVSKVGSIANATIPGYPAPLPAVNDGAPFGPGYSAYVNYYGMEPLNGITTYYADLNTVDTQYAAFGEANYKITEKLKATAGLRVSRNRVSIDTYYDGPNSNLNAPRGYACVPGTGAPGAPACIPVAVGQYAPGEGPFALSFVSGGAVQSETAVTPRFSLAYQASNRHLFYATAAKGFRPGGAQQRQPSTCNDQLVALGYVDSEGRAQSPTTFDSDTVWSYEIGAKNRIGNVQLSTSAYYIDWKNIQSLVSLSSCVQTIIDNLGSAKSKGFDVQLQGEVIDGLMLSAAVAYNHTSFDEATVFGGRTLFTQGAAIPGAGSPWNVTLGGQYDFPVGSSDAYIRSDYTYQSAFRRTGATDPGTVSYDHMLIPRAATHMVNLRAGVKVDKVDISLFVNNVLNASPSLGLQRTNNQPVFTDYSFRPRTVGLTASFRH